MATTYDIGETTIPDLPTDALSHIFSYLPHNIRVVRLVCRKWNESCNCIKVSGHEKIVIGDENMEPERIEKFFSSTLLLRNIYNLHLKNIAFRTNHLSFFEIFGCKLRSLTLHNCSAEKHVLFLRFCKNLNTLVLSRCSPSIIRSFRRLDGTFTQTEVVSLKITEFQQWSDETMDGCFRTCPKLRALTLKGLNFGVFQWAEGRYYSFVDGEERVLNRSDIFSFDCIRHFLVTRAANIIELNLGSISKIPSEPVEQIASIPDLKLRKLKLSAIDLSPSHMSNIVTLQPNLQNIVIRRCNGVCLRESADWIEKCSNLTRLKILSDVSFVLHEKLFNALTSRLHLRELVLITGGDTFIVSAIENSPGVFNHLRTLKLGVSNIYYRCVLEKVTVNLQHLTLKLSLLPNTDNLVKTLEFVSNRFTILESLNVSFESGSPELVELYEEDYFYERISFGTLKRLRTLQLTVPSREDFSTNLLRQFKAPNLQCLELSGLRATDSTSLSDMMNNYPLLECFKLSNRQFTGNPPNPRAISGLERLNFFYFNGREYLELHRRGEREKKCVCTVRPPSW